MEASRQNRVFTIMSMNKSISNWIDDLRSSDKALSKEASRALSYMGAAVVEPLLETLRDNQMDLKLLASIFGQIGEPALEGLGLRLQDIDPFMREQAARVLALIADSRSVLPLVMALDDTEAPVRAATAKALGNFADPRAISALIETLGDSSAEVRSNAAEALGSYYRDPRVIPALIKAADDDEVIVRVGTARAMAKVQDERIKSKLKKMIDDTSSDVRLTAAAALQHQEGDRMVFERMNVDVSDVVDNISRQMLEDEIIDENDMDLMRNSNPRVRARLLELVGESNSNTAVGMILPGLKDINPAVRQTAIDTLVHLGVAVVEPLIQALNDESKYARTGIIDALAIIADARSIDAICQRVEKDKAEEVRAKAAQALANFETTDRIIKSLKQALKDSDKTVRDAAEQSLARLGVDTSNPLSRFFRRFTGNK
jgi:HEAT repeat protein